MNGSNFSRLIKKNSEIQSLDRSGITRISYGWWVRLGFHNHKPAFQVTVKDSDFDGNSAQSFLRAYQIVQENKPKYPVTWTPETNLVKGLTLTKATNHSGKTHYYTWGFSYREDGKSKNRKFGFWRSGNIYEQYFKAVGFGISKGNKKETSLQLRLYFFNYIAKMMSDDVFLSLVERSDFKQIDFLKHNTQILYSRYIKRYENDQNKSIFNVSKNVQDSPVSSRCKNNKRRY